MLLRATLLSCAALAAQDGGARPAPTVVRMATLPGLRYEFTKFDVVPGAAVELVIENKDSMMHNLLITRPGARMKVVMQAIALGAEAEKVDYIPKSADVLWSVGVIKPDETRRLRFKAPAEVGDYPYVCTYPGHGFVMFGTMAVTRSPGPPVRSQQAVMESAHQHAEHDRIVVRRMFMPDAGPAAIAVSQPGGLSYCWDAGACRLRYAWAGGPITKVKMGTAPALTGPVLLRAVADFPLRVGSDPALRPTRVRFRGYRLDAAGEPEFEYAVDGVEVRERITMARGRLQQTFRVAGDPGTVWLLFDGARAPEATPAGTVREGTDGGPALLRFDGAGARAFSVSTPLDVHGSGGGKER